VHLTVNIFPSFKKISTKSEEIIENDNIFMSDFNRVSN